MVPDLGESPAAKWAVDRRRRGNLAGRAASSKSRRTIASTTRHSGPRWAGSPRPPARSICRAYGLLDEAHGACGRPPHHGVRHRDFRSAASICEDFPAAAMPSSRGRSAAVRRQFAPAGGKWMDRRSACKMCALAAALRNARRGGDGCEPDRGRALLWGGSVAGGAGRPHHRPLSIRHGVGRVRSGQLRRQRARGPSLDGLCSSRSCRRINRRRYGQ